MGFLPAKCFITSTEMPASRGVQGRIAPLLGARGQRPRNLAAHSRAPVYTWRKTGNAQRNGIMCTRRQLKAHLRAALWGALLTALTACTLARVDDSPQAVRAKLAAQLADAQSAQMTATDLWERLIAGEEVSCQEAIPTPPPLTLSERELRAHPSAASVTDALNQAQQALRDAAELWEGTCTTPDVSVPLETARAARQALRTASAALEQAAALLAAW